MIKISTFVVLLLLTSLAGFSQTREAIDNLHGQLVNAKDDTSRINALTQLCLLHRLGHTDSSLIYGQKALELSKRINYIRGQIPALGFMCIVTEQQGDLPKSLELGFEALQLGEDHHLQSLTGPAFDGIGEAYILLKDYPKAISYIRRNIQTEIDRNNPDGLAYGYFDMGVAFAALNQLDSAIFYEQKAIETFRKANHEEPLVYQTLGDVAIKSGKPGEALNYYQVSLQISLKNSEPRASAYAYNKIAAFYKDANKPDSAIFYALKGLNESQSINQKKTILEAAALLSELYEPTDTKESLTYLKIAGLYKDSLFGTGSLDAVQKLAARQEERQREIEASRTAYQNKLKQYALLGGLVMLLVVTFFLYRNNRKEKKAKNLLREKNEVIEQTLEHLSSTQAQLIHSEKMASLGELTAGIAHEIQNPLNFVNNFSEVNKELLTEMNDEIDKGNFGEVKELAKNVIENEEKITHHGKRADAIVKGMLQHSRTSGGQKEPTDINALCDEYVRLSYHGLRAKDKSFNAKFETDFDNSLGKIKIAPQDIGRVILNLINNAFYATREKAKLHISGYEPTVIIKTSKADKGVLITVRDNGPGIPGKVMDKIFQPFFTTKPTGEGTGLGLSLSYDIIKAHGGEIKVETKENEGSAFIVQLPA